MNDLEYIDNYFKGGYTPEQTRMFEDRIEQDPAFATEVAFYLSARQVARDQMVEDKKKRFKELYAENDNINVITPVRKLWRYVAAAAIIATLLVGGYFYLQPQPSSQLASEYIITGFDKMGVTMGNEADSLMIGKSYYNDGKYPQALRVFESILQRDRTQSSYEVMKSAGIVSLRMKDYDKALGYFKEMEQFRLHSNPGMFYQAITLLDRNATGDTEKAEALLRVVVQEEREGKDIAREWLKHF